MKSAATAAWIASAKEAILGTYRNDLSEELERIKSASVQRVREYAVQSDYAQKRRWLYYAKAAGFCLADSSPWCDSEPAGHAEMPEHIESAEAEIEAIAAARGIALPRPPDDPLTWKWGDVYPPHEITSGQSTPPAQISRGATAPTAPGLTRVAQDGERLGRLAWMPGAK